MPRVESKKEINAPVEKIYEVLTDLMLLPRWNIVINEIKELEKDKYFLKTNVGDVINIVTERVPNKSITSKQEESPLNSIGYILEPKGDVVEATVWATFDDEEQGFVFEMAGDLFIKSLKVYVDYLMDGGNPEEYKKRLSKIKKA